MERILLQSSSKEDIRLIAELAKKMGVSIEHLPSEVNSIVSEPNGLVEWGKLSKNQQQGLLDAIKEAEHSKGRSNDEVMSEFIRKYEE